MLALSSSTPCFLLWLCSEMDSSTVELDHEFLPLLRVYKNGHVERLIGTEFVPPSTDPQSAISSKDVTINKEICLSARLYFPTTTPRDTKLPLLIYFHGGGFLIESAFSPFYHNYLNSIVEEPNIVAVSVEYRLAPEHPLPVAYNDCWEAIQWVASHSEGESDEVWLNNHVDFDKVILGGDSAGANIVHNMAMRARSEDLANNINIKFEGIVLVHPLFWGEEVMRCEGSNPERKEFIDKIWVHACASTMEKDNPCINPVAEGAPSLNNLGCSKVLIFVAEKDVLRDRGWVYYETLKKSGWGGVVEIVQTMGQDHVFHLRNPACDEAISKRKILASFINQEL